MTKRRPDPGEDEDLSFEEPNFAETRPDPSSSSKPRKRKDAFDILMASQFLPTVSSAPRVDTDGLAAYLQPKERRSLADEERVIFETDASVAIQDKYPKSTIHCLIIPRDLTRYRAKDPNGSPVANLSRGADVEEFLAPVRKDIEKLKQMIAGELQKRYGEYTTPDRDWAGELKVGVHLKPSMPHLHIHVMSPDMCSDSMKKTGHYQSFATGFLVPFELFPIQNWEQWEKDAKGRHMTKGPVECWRCGRAFPKFQELKSHLALEFGQWVKHGC